MNISGVQGKLVSKPTSIVPNRLLLLLNNFHGTEIAVTTDSESKLPFQKNSNYKIKKLKNHWSAFAVNSRFVQEEL